MSHAPDKSSPAPAAVEGLHHRLKFGLFSLATINGLSTAYYIQWIFFYMEQKFGLGRAGNLLLCAFYGFSYMVAAASYGRLAHRHGYFHMLRMGLVWMTAALGAGCVLAWTVGYTNGLMYTQCLLLVAWGIGTSFTWPTLQALLSREAPGELPRAVGIYNLLWAVGGAIAQFTGGALLDHFGGEALFWLPVGMNLVQMVITRRLHRLSDTAKTVQPANPAPVQTAATIPDAPRSTAKANAFLRLALAANPFCYIAIYGLVPITPQLSERLGLTTTKSGGSQLTYAGIVFSVWLWSRLAAFYWFSHWSGWHYRFRWLVAAYLAMIASFVAMLLSPNLPILIAAQLIFGLAVGLIYSSSLYYSMDVGASKSKRGGIHEAVIGFGIGAGPAIGYGALRGFPTQPSAIAWSIGGALAAGFLLFLTLRFRWWHNEPS
jgi:MFS family permease